MQYLDDVASLPETDTESTLGETEVLRKLDPHARHEPDGEPGHTASMMEDHRQQGYTQACGSEDTAKQSRIKVINGKRYLLPGVLCK